MIRTESIQALHEKAMAFAEAAAVAERGGDLAKTLQLSRLAFWCEAAAANLVPDDGDVEPTRSVLYRSAAALALDCADDEVLDAINGLYRKYVVRRTDGKPVDFCFVLEPEKDPAARIALRVYAEATPNEQLRKDLLAVLEEFK